MRFRGYIDAAAHGGKIYEGSIDVAGDIAGLIAAELLQIENTIAATLPGTLSIANYDTDAIPFGGEIAGMFGDIVTSAYEMDTLYGGGHGGSGGPDTDDLRFTASDTPPVSPNVGDRWLDTTTGREFTWFDDGDSSQWVQIDAIDGAGGRGLRFYAQDTAPDDALPGDRWFDLSSGYEYTLVDDGDSIQWVEHF